VTALPTTGLAGLHYPITQISLAVRDLDRTMERYHRLFGWAPWQVFDHVPPVHHATELRGRPVHYALRGAEVYVGALNFELLQPLEGPNLWSELIDRRGEGIASIATMFHERADGDAVKREFLARFGIPVSMKADIGDHIEYYYLDTEARFGCLIESGSGHAIDFVRPAQVYPSEGAVFGPSPTTGLTCPITQVSIVVRDLDARLAAYEEAFGWGPWRRFDGRPGAAGGSAAVLSDCRIRGEAVDGFAVRFAQARVDDLNVELIEPLGGPDPWQAFLDANGEGIASIAVTFATAEEVDRLRAAFEGLGIGVLASARVGAGVTDAGVAAGADWLLFDSTEQLKCLIASGTGHALDLAAGNAGRA
jgi:catechol 2,3-dioxygenase-like lactoylglutathione lyase family enzyme